MSPSQKKKILIVDDEADILEFLSFNIIKAGYEVHTADNGKEALAIADEILPDMIILDVMMPEMDGIETCEELRKSEKHKDKAIIFLTARSEDYSQIAGFTAGADDYIGKPVKPKVLVHRIEAILKRTTRPTDKNLNEESTLIESEGIIIDKERFLIIQDGNEMSLPRKEFELLSLLMSKPDKVFTRTDIFNRIWDVNTIVGERTIDVHIRKLREKIGDKYIKTIKGVGYKFTGPNS